WQRDETHFETPVQGHADSLKHLERVPGVIGGFEPRDHRVCGPDQSSELLLSEPGPATQGVDLLCDLPFHRAISSTAHAANCLRFSRFQPRLRPRLNSCSTPSRHGSPARGTNGSPRTPTHPGNKFQNPL